MIANLHYISQASGGKSHFEAIQAVVEAGATCVQLRIKQVTAAELLPIAQQVQQYCQVKGVQLIINDHVDIAKQIGAAGVHIGKNDMPPEEARSILGDQMIIGGTANDWEDIQRLAAAGVDYIGLGPFRFTSTKKALSPILGVAGYESIIQQYKEAKINIPLIAIGGIVLEDIPSLMATGIHGVAISGFLTKYPEQTKPIQSLIQEHRDTETQRPST